MKKTNEYLKQIGLRRTTLLIDVDDQKLMKKFEQSFVELEQKELENKNEAEIFERRADILQGFFKHTGRLEIVELEVLTKRLGIQESPLNFLSKYETLLPEMFYMFYKNDDYYSGGSVRMFKDTDVIWDLEQSEPELFLEIAEQLIPGYQLKRTFNKTETEAQLYRMLDEEIERVSSEITSSPIDQIFNGVVFEYLRRDMNDHLSIKAKATLL